MGSRAFYVETSSRRRPEGATAATEHGVPARVPRPACSLNPGQGSGRPSPSSDPRAGFWTRLCHSSRGPRAGHFHLLHGERWQRIGQFLRFPLGLGGTPLPWLAQAGSPTSTQAPTSPRLSYCLPSAAHSHPPAWASLLVPGHSCLPSCIKCSGFYLSLYLGQKCPPRKRVCCVLLGLLQFVQEQSRG